MLAPAYALVLAAPGPNLLVVLRASLAGRGSAGSAACGIACGAGLAALAAMLLAAWLREDLMTGMHVIEVAGRLVFAALMTRMGWRSLRRAIRRAAPASPDVEATQMRAHFRLGLIAALSNPLTVPFFAGFFLGHPETRDPAIALLACALIMGMAGVWFSAVGLTLARGGWHGRLGAHRWPEALIGCGLLLYGGLTLRGLFP